MSTLPSGPLDWFRAATDWDADDDFEPEETDTSADFQKNEFLDLREPLFMQVLRANWSKSYYLQQVHQPRHLADSPRLFGPWYLEVGFNIRSTHLFY